MTVIPFDLTVGERRGLHCMVQPSILECCSLSSLVKNYFGKSGPDHFHLWSAIERNRPSSARTLSGCCKGEHTGLEHLIDLCDYLLGCLCGILVA